MIFGARLRSSLSSLASLASLAVLVLASALLALAPTQAAANSKYAAFVMDADSGEVLYARNGDLNRFPASLTKMMTLYMVFEALDTGQLSINETFTASRRAAAQAPSKIGIRAGQSITVDAAIRALVVKSANDVAVVVAEALGSTESQFAEMMTRRARALGMSQTRFRNASGLPNAAQVTTAREMARLSQRLLHDFPEYAHYFNLRSFSWGGRTYTTHNHLLKNYAGSDGMKTGYTRASGFNVATSVRRDGYHLIGVVMGGRTSQSRDREMVRIMDLTFSRLKDRPRERRPLLARIELPRAKPKQLSEASVLVAGLLRGDELGDLDALPVYAAAEAGAGASAAGADAMATLILASLSEGEDSLPRPHPGRADFTDDLEALEPRPNPERPKAVSDDTVAATRARMTAALDRLATSPTMMARTDPSALLGEEVDQGDGGPWQGTANRLSADDLSGWGVQIGAFSSVAGADEHLQAASNIAGELNMSRAGVMPVDRDGGETIFRARFGPLPEEAARDACRELKEVGMACFTVEEADWSDLIRR